LILAKDRNKSVTVAAPEASIISAFIKETEPASVDLSTGAREPITLIVSIDRFCSKAKMEVEQEAAKIAANKENFVFIKLRLCICSTRA
jgi:hypothetical protein